MKTTLLSIFSALLLIAAGCGGGTNTPADSGHDGFDGHVAECTTASQCDDGNPCTNDDCVSEKCTHVNNSVPCDDGQACSTDDHCQDGVCIGGASQNCDDGNPCTTDGCSDTSGCTHVNNSLACDDGSACTYGEFCQNGACGGGQVLDCDDSNLCTDDACDPGRGCVHTNNTVACDDHRACSTNDHCQDGVCTGDSSTNCDDNNPCTTDSCDDALGCVHTFNTATCDDHNACTENDACERGVCKGGSAVNCNDGNACTDDTCDMQSGCQHANNTSPCEDGNACTVGDQCSGGQCVPGAGPDCNDNNPCTTDSCSPQTGCTHANNTNTCDDGDACTMNDVCAGGQCHGVPLDQDGDHYVPTSCGGNDCNDNNVAVNPGATEGPSGTPTCSDSIDNDCDGATDTADSTCRQCTNNSDCSDNNVCNGTETCQNSVCVAGTPLTCNDSNPCTDDSCNPTSGCTYVNDNTNTCTDNNACTNDACVSGTCQSSAITCNDNNPCTDDSCNPASGCVFVNDNTNTCTDNNACTNDACVSGTCQSTARDCNDNNVCTQDSCVPSSGCQYQNLTGPCDDGNACTTGDTCTGGQCVGSPRDQDGDTFGDRACGGTDCNDTNPQIYPGRAEVCGNSLDDNCNDIVDEGCASCTAIDATAELIIDNDVAYSIVPLAAGDMVLNGFFVEAEAYKVFAVKAAFFDVACASGTNQGRYSARIFADDNGKPGTEVGSSPVSTLNVTGTCADQQQQITWATFTLSAPVSFTHGQIFWVAVRSEDDESTDQYLPLFDGGILDPYIGGVAYFTPSGNPRDYYSIGVNAMVRAQGCADGPWLKLASHTQTPATVPAGGTATIQAPLRNRGYAATGSVTGTLSSPDADVVMTTGSASYGTIAVGATANNNPNFAIQATSSAFGIYGLGLDSTDGPHNWSDGFGVYVQGTGCTADNRTLQTDDNTPTYVIPQAANDEVGNYFVVDSASFALRSVDVTFYKTVSSPTSRRFRLKIYTYRAGLPDQTLYTGNWVTVSGSNQFVVNFPVSPALTFKNGDTFWATIQSESDQSGLEYFAILSDDGNSQASPASWYNGVVKPASTGAWSPMYVSMIIRPKGCAATELRYASHTTSPSPVVRGTPANITVTVANDGAIAASNVTATLTSTTTDVTVSDGSAAFGTVPANGTKAATDPFVVTVSNTSTAYQFIMQIDITDGTTTWRDYFPLVIQGGYVDLGIQNFTATLAGSDIIWHWEVVNNGNIDLFSPFRVDFYLNRETAPGTNVNGDWNNTPTGILRGTPIPYDLQLPGADPGTYKSWVQVDTLVQISESNENNNVAGPATVTIGDDAFVLLNPARKWFPANIPVHYRFASGTQPGMPAGQDKVAVRNGFAHWQAVTPATIAFVEDSQTGPAGYVYDGLNTMTFNDPTGEVPSGAIAATLPIYDSQTMVTNGVTFNRMVDSDIVFNDGMPFGTNAQAAACATQVFDMEGVATHEQGHFIGLDHAAQIDATMYYAVDYCDASKITLEASDINGTNFIYPP
ncbi:MAG: matrixin family metalloprotease [Myxococcales bacterium]|nr:matrixin family metalloprotease [Myxococcales bacterium]